MDKNELDIRLNNFNKDLQEILAKYQFNMIAQMTFPVAWGDPTSPLALLNVPIRVVPAAQAPAPQAKVIKAE